MNDIMDLYLGRYCEVDDIDHLLKNWDIKYCTCWKWYHSHMRYNHGMAYTELEENENRRKQEKVITFLFMTVLSEVTFIFHFPLF